MKFKKRPVVIKAYQITKELLTPILLDGLPYPKGLTLGGASYHRNDRTIYSWRGYVTTIHGQETKVTIGDWIITEPDGKHFYPCKPDIFEATYEPV